LWAAEGSDWFLQPTQGRGFHGPCVRVWSSTINGCARESSVRACVHGACKHVKPSRSQVRAMARSRQDEACACGGRPQARVLFYPGIFFPHTHAGMTTRERAWELGGAPWVHSYLIYPFPSLPLASCELRDAEAEDDARRHTGAASGGGGDGAAAGGVASDALPSSRGGHACGHQARAADSSGLRLRPSRHRGRAGRSGGGSSGSWVDAAQGSVHRAQELRRSACMSDAGVCR